ncbi:MAG: hypothetical protein FJ033_03810 [Chloroflexi bacterium]|nr:hypothetical protein [Chloroflexota bacterium]
MNRRHRRLVAVHAIALIAATAFAWLPLTAGQFWGSDDGGDHLFRALSLERTLESQTLYPRWSPQFAAGLGYPVFHFYAPTASFLSAGLQVLGANPLVGLVGVAVVSLLIGAAGAYVLGRSTGEGHAPFLVSLTYVTAPYTLIDLWYRAALPELLGMAIVPWLLIAFERVARTPDARRLLVASITTTALALTHNITLLLLIPVVAIRASIISLSSPCPLISVVGAAAAGTVGLMLSSFYWLPALADRNLVRWEILVTGWFDFRNHFSSVFDVIQPSLVYRYGFNPELSQLFRVGMLQVVLALIGGSILVARGSPGLGAFFGGLMIASLLLQIDISRPLWEVVAILGFVQFPFRLLGLTTIASAMLVGGLVKGLAPRSALWTTVAVTALWIYSSGIDLKPTLLDLRPDEVNLSALGRIEVDRRLIGSSTLGEFLPRTVPSDFWSRLGDPPALALPPARIVGATQDGAGSLRISVDRSDDEREIVIDQHAFPLWAASSRDGHILESTAEPHRGLWRIRVPPGTTEIMASPGSGAWGDLARAITFLGLLILIVLAVRAHRRRLALVGVITAVAGVFWGIGSPFSGQGGAAHGRDVGGFSGGARVIDAAISGTRVSLIWTADNPIHRDLRVAIRLIDSEGRVVARRDTRPRAGLRPTTSWMPGYLIRDELDLDLIDPRPGGHVLVAVGLFDPNGYATPSFGDIVTWVEKCPCAAPNASGSGLALGQVTLSSRGTAPPNSGGDGPVVAGAIRLVSAEIVAEDLLAPTRGPRDRLDRLMARIEQRLWPPTPQPGASLGGPAGVAATIDPGATLSVRTRWEAIADPLDDYAVTVQLLDQSGRMVTQDDAWPRRGLSPTSLWATGKRVDDRYAPFLPNKIEPALGRLVLGVYRRTDLRRLHWEPPGPEPDWIELGTVKVRPARSSPTPAVALRHDFGLVRLAGLAVPLPERPRPGDTIDVRPIWHVNADPGADFTVFAHLIGSGSEPEATGDRPPLAGHYPTRAWQAGETFADQYAIEIPSSARGSYQIRLGFYRSDTGIRMVGPDGDAASIGRVVVEP